MATKRIERKDLVAPDAITSVIDETVKLEAQLTKVVSINKELLKTNPLKSTEDVKNFNKDIQSTVKSTESLAKVTKQLNSQTDEEVRGRIRLQRAQKAQRDTLKDLVVLEDREAGTLEKLNALNRKLRRERAALNLDTEKGVKRLKEINVELDKNNKRIKENSDAMKKQRLNVGNYKDSVKEALDETNLFGTSIGGLGDTLTTFVKSPLAAVTAGFTALGALYASSTSGARDLRAAQTQLNTIFTGFGERLANLVGSKGGQGLLSAFTSQFTRQFFGAGAAAEASAVAEAQIQLEKLQVDQLESDRLAKDQLDRIERLRQIRDDEAQSIQERNRANERIAQIIQEREEQQVAVLIKRILQAKILKKADEENVELQLLVKQLEFEIADVREDNAGQLSEQLANVNSLRREAAALAKKEAAAQEELNKQLDKEAEIRQEIENISPLPTRKAETTETEQQAKAQGELATNLEATNAAYGEQEDIVSILQEREEQLRQQREETTELILQSIDVVGTALEAQSQKRLALLDQELDSTRKKEDRQAQLAAQGLENTLAFEEKKAAELERKREQEAEKQERRQKVLAYLAQFTELSKSDANGAAAKALANVAIAEAVSGLFYEGTEKVEDDVAGKPFFPGKDGYLVRVDGSERIMTGEQNRRIGNISNEDLANIAEAYNKGQLINYGINDKNIIRELQEVRKGLSQVSTHIEIDKDGIVTRRDLKNGLKKISRKHPPRI
tara:strand:+ start:879 stop:3074 length:2196 start_codon:yes stop_codon:yes gene_type:complete